MLIVDDDAVRGDAVARELYGEMRRGSTVLKTRGSKHDKETRELTIDDSGLRVGNAFRNVSGVLAGNPRQVPAGELERMGRMFQEGP